MEPVCDFSWFKLVSRSLQQRCFTFTPQTVGGGEASLSNKTCKKTTTITFTGYLTICFKLNWTRSEALKMQLVNNQRANVTAQLSVVAFRIIATVWMVNQSSCNVVSACSAAQTGGYF